MARRGARVVRDPGQRSASEVWREAVERAGPPDQDRAAQWEPDQGWVEDPAEVEAHQEDLAPRPPVVVDRSKARPDTRATTQRAATQKTTTPNTAPPARGTAARVPAAGSAQENNDARRHNVPRPVVEELSAAAGAQRGVKLAARLADATHAYDRDRYQEARRILRTLAGEVPDAAAVRELYGLVLYRLEQWVPAAKELEIYRQLSGSFDQHPVLADCYRALHRYPAAEALWDELRSASPGAELVAEGRIVAAGCRADQGDLEGAIELLERSGRRVRHPQEHHLRQWYALANLYERAGDLPRAREIFNRVAAADPEAFDVRERLRGLR